jgi:hypothetical protein
VSINNSIKNKLIVLFYLNLRNTNDDDRNRYEKVTFVLLRNRWELEEKKEKEVETLVWYV